MAQMVMDDAPRAPWYARVRERTVAFARTTTRAVSTRTSLDGVLRVIATLLVPAGIAAIVLGWNGAAHTPFVFEQVPYLISGGLLGVGLVTCGGLLYLASWISRSAHMARERDEQLREVLVAMQQELRDVRKERDAQAAVVPPMLDRPGEDPALALAASGATTEVPAVQPFVATPSGTMYHRPECGVVANRDDLKQVSTEDGLKPCGICEPHVA